MIVKMFGNSWLGMTKVVLRVNMSLIHASLISGLEIEALRVRSGGSKSGSKLTMVLRTGR